MRNNFKKLEQLARERGYTVSRAGREILWRSNIRPDHEGRCFLVSDAVEEIRLHYDYLLKNNDDD